MNTQEPLNADGYTRKTYAAYCAAVSKAARENRYSADITHGISSILTLAGVPMLDAPSGYLATGSMILAGMGLAATVVSMETAALSAERAERKLSAQPWASAPQGFLTSIAYNPWDTCTGILNRMAAIDSSLGLIGYLIALVISL